MKAYNISTFKSFFYYLGCFFLASLFISSCQIFNSDSNKQKNFLAMKINGESWNSDFTFGSYSRHNNTSMESFLAVASRGGISGLQVSDFINIRLSIPINDEKESGIFNFGRQKEAYIIYSAKDSQSAQPEDQFLGEGILTVNKMTDHIFSGTFEVTLINRADSSVTMPDVKGEFYMSF